MENIVVKAKKKENGEIINIDYVVDLESYSLKIPKEILSLECKNLVFHNLTSVECENKDTEIFFQDCTFQAQHTHYKFGSIDLKNPHWRGKSNTISFEDTKNFQVFLEENNSYQNGYHGKSYDFFLENFGFNSRFSDIHTKNIYLKNGNINQSYIKMDTKYMYLDSVGISSDFVINFQEADQIFLRDSSIETTGMLVLKNAVYQSTDLEKVVLTGQEDNIRRFLSVLNTIRQESLEKVEDIYKKDEQKIDSEYENFK